MPPGAGELASGIVASIDPDLARSPRTDGRQLRLVCRVGFATRPQTRRYRFDGPTLASRRAPLEARQADDRIVTTSPLRVDAIHRRKLDAERWTRDRGSFGRLVAGRILSVALACSVHVVRHRLSVVILNYDADVDLLVAAVESVTASTGIALGSEAAADTQISNNQHFAEHDTDRGPAGNKNAIDETTIVLQEILVVDNASPTKRVETKRAIESIAVWQPIVRWLDLPVNTGFAGGTNRAILACRLDSDLVFCLNPDAKLEPTALRLCVDALDRADPSCVSIAPKMMLAGFTNVLDSVGNAINDRGEAFNIGLGQPDLGQYDQPRPIFGPCFGAGLFRRDAFDRTKVGPLDESLFLYYEDVDWNWRAQALGYTSMSEPRAVVHHQMSATTRHLAYDFKFHLTERNLLVVSLKNFSFSRSAHIWFWRCGGLLKGAFNGHFPTAGPKAVAGALLRAPNAIIANLRLRKRRKRNDSEIVEYGLGEKTFFDSVTYQPVNQREAEAFARNKLLS